MSYTKEDFYVGQRVRVRDADDMIAEFGIDGRTGNFIECDDVCFNISGMEEFCGATAEITAVLFEEEHCDTVALGNWEDCSGKPLSSGDPYSWTWTTCMIEPWELAVIKPSFDNDLFTRLLTN